MYFFVSFLALKHLHKLAIPAVRTHACREVVRVCTYSYVFQLCIVSSMLALSAHANTRISSSHAHTRAYAQALADAFLYISSLRNVCCSCLCMQVSLICLWHSAQPSGRASRVLLTGPENRFASCRGFDTTRHVWRRESRRGPAGPRPSRECGARTCSRVLSRSIIISRVPTYPM